LKISIITSVFNNKDNIAQAIESVSSQTYKNIEHIIIDGGSTDGTIDVVNTFKNQLAVVVSEKDNGIYDGLNKGIALATGDIIGFLHSDDLYEDEFVIEKVAAAFTTHNVDSVYGDLVYVNKNDTSKIVRYWKSGEFTPKKLRKGWMPPHPTLFIKRRIYEEHGVFNTNFKIAADYDLILRFLGKYSISTHYIPNILIRMRVGGASNKSLRNIYLKSSEDLRAMQENSVGNIFSLVIKNISKLHQFILSK
jgi:glycosyltransferase